MACRHRGKEQPLGHLRGLHQTHQGRTGFPLFKSHPFLFFAYHSHTFHTFSDLDLPGRCLPYKSGDSLGTLRVPCCTSVGLIFFFFFRAKASNGLPSILSTDNQRMLLPFSLICFLVCTQAQIPPELQYLSLHNMPCFLSPSRFCFSRVLLAYVIEAVSINTDCLLFSYIFLSRANL